MRSSVSVVSLVDQVLQLRIGPNSRRLRHGVFPSGTAKATISPILLREFILVLPPLGYAIAECVLGQKKILFGFVAHFDRGDRRAVWKAV